MVVFMFLSLCFEKLSKSINLPSSPSFRLHKTPRTSKMVVLGCPGLGLVIGSMVIGSMGYVISYVLINGG